MLRLVTCVADISALLSLSLLPPGPQVKGVMVQNIDKMTERGDKLEDLGERAGVCVCVCVCVCVRVCVTGGHIHIHMHMDDTYYPHP